jgi:hypothetical protein
MDRVGSPHPDGVGAVRCFHAGPTKVREEVLEFDPPRRMVYRVASGLPVVDYRSEMVLDPEDGGAASLLRWSSSFRPRVPGTGALLRAVMVRAVAGFAVGIAAAAEAEAGAGGATGTGPASGVSR